MMSPSSGEPLPFQHGHSFLSISSCRWGQRCLSLLLLLPCVFPHLGLNPAPSSASGLQPTHRRRRGRDRYPGVHRVSRPNPCGGAHLFDSKRKKRKPQAVVPPVPPVPLDLHTLPKHTHTCARYCYYAAW